MAAQATVQVGFDTKQVLQVQWATIVLVTEQIEGMLNAGEFWHDETEGVVSVIEILKRVADVYDGLIGDTL